MKTTKTKEQEDREQAEIAIWWHIHRGHMQAPATQEEMEKRITAHINKRANRPYTMIA
jgi:hypothetical protein